MQFITVKGYEYLWTGKPLEVGDTVMLPAPYWKRDPWVGTVQSVSDPKSYDGALKSVLCKVAT